ncbi:MAG TPA: ribosome small subunit-dependent GTPase A [Tissierellia bacterium]|nr:ribosome small subunit-dependent GTPase A [Tissierellia bacterium]
MIPGRIISAMAGFYHVKAEGQTYLCRPRGIFRKTQHTPAVGDLVMITTDGPKGTIERIAERSTLLTRPFVANVTSALLQFSIRDPAPDLLLLDTLIVNCLYHDIEPILLFNKTDLNTKAEAKALAEIYRASGFEMHFISVLEGDGLTKLTEALAEGIYVLAGQSGVGKSSLINQLATTELAVGDISKKLGRGRHTTRHTSLVELRDDVYLVDTPGFQNLHLEAGITPEDIVEGYPEFFELGDCQFYNCLHQHEPRCVIKQAYQSGLIHPRRYDNYLILQQRLQERKEY